jgi:acetyl-CoA carboxylase biotin carboxyl carrier protein
MTGQQPEGSKMSIKKNGVDQQLIRDLAGILNDTNLTEIEVELGDLKVRVSRQAPAVHAIAAPQPAYAPAPAQAAAVPAVVDVSKNAVASPMVGTAYLAPEPGKPNFVAIGDKVTAGQTLLIIEAMKTFNPIKAPKAGTVMQILVDNARPVEFGEPLMIVE